MFCYHTHIFGDRIISHSHPFNNPDYHHTVTEIEALEIISTSALTDCISEVPELVSPDTYIIIVPATIVAGLVDSTERTTAERAPPVA